MLTKQIVAAGLAAVLMTFTTAAPAAQRVVGDWLVTVEADRFSDANKTVVALTVSDDGVLAVRCLSSRLSLALLGKYRTGDIFIVKFRADRHDIIDTKAAAISDEVMEIHTPPEMVRQMLSAKEYAFRVIGVARSDFVFRAGRGASRAIGEVTKACPLE